MVQTQRVVSSAALLGLTTVAAPVLWTAGAAARALLRSRSLVIASRPYERRVAAPRGRILVIGDSIAAGVGVARPEESLPGLLGAQHPEADVTNVAVVGARWRDLPRQLGRARESHYDLALIIAAGNDIVRATPRADLQRDVDWALRFAARKATQTIVIGSPNIGNAPIFGWPLRSIITSRTRLVRAVLRDACAERGAHFVDLFLDAASDFIARDPKLFYAADGFHPSAASHRYVLERINSTVSLPAVLGGDARAAADRKFGVSL